MGLDPGPDYKLEYLTADGVWRQFGDDTPPRWDEVPHLRFVDITEESG